MKKPCNTLLAVIILLFTATTDATSSTLYWSDSRGIRSQEVDADGRAVGNVIDVIGLSDPNGTFRGNELEIDAFTETLYWIQGGTRQSISRYSVTEKKLEEEFFNFTDFNTNGIPRRLSFNQSTNELFLAYEGQYGAQGGIIRINTAGQATPTVGDYSSIPGPGSVSFQAIDSEGDLLYWIGSNQRDRLMMVASDTDARNRTTLIESSDTLSPQVGGVPATGSDGFQVDLDNEYLFFTSRRGSVENRVYRSELDGTNPEILIDYRFNRDILDRGTGFRLEHLEVDPVAGRIYWTDNEGDGRSRVWSSDYDGNDIQFLFESRTNEFDFRGIAISVVVPEPSSLLIFGFSVIFFSRRLTAPRRARCA